MPPRAVTSLQHALDLVKASASKEQAQRALETAIAAATLPAAAETPPAYGRGKTFYDRLAEDILSQVKQAVSREALVRSVITTLRTGQSEGTALGYLVLSSHVGEGDELQPVVVTASAGFNEHRIANFQTNRAASLASSTLIRDVLISGDSIDFLPTELVRKLLYFGEFDDLLDDVKRGAWVCAVPLPSADVRHPVQMLVALYPAGGAPDSPSLPRGASLEWRVFGFLRAAYELLNHQLNSTADLLALQRRELIADLAPGIVNHEINQQLVVLDDSLNVINYCLRERHAAGGHDDNLAKTIKGLVLAYRSTERLHRIANAFNNLDRRAPVVRLPLSQLLGEVTTLAYSRLANAGVHLVIDGGGLEVELQTDPALIEHVLLNVLVNATEAIVHDAEAVRAQGPRPARTILVRVDATADQFSILIMNDGPSVRGPRPDRIFERGYTSKPLGVGHGLGLYVCRLVMTYLGGAIELADRAQLAPGMTVGFHVHGPLKAATDVDLMESSSTAGAKPTARRRH